jgi:isopenicillin-N N-acyltransferase like protein
MQLQTTRRAFLASTALAATGLALPRCLFAEASWPKVADHSLTLVTGNPRERGRQYGKQFSDVIAKFLDREIVRPFGKKATRDDMVRYAGQCAKEIRSYAPEIYDELEGMAEGAGMRLEDVVAITLHEEFYHQGILPKAEHCTAIAAGPPDTDDNHAYVGQTWDWFVSLYGVSQILLWKRTEGPSVLAYAYPGLWVGAGLNSEGIALCWTSAQGKDIAGPRVGIPSYVLIAQMLYQETLNSTFSHFFDLSAVPPACARASLADPPDF